MIVDIDRGGEGGHARYVGRVGALAVALGVGMAVATATGSAVAQADTASSESAGASTSSEDSDSTRSPSTDPESDSDPDPDAGTDEDAPDEDVPDEDEPTDEDAAGSDDVAPAEADAPSGADTTRESRADHRDRSSAEDDEPETANAATEVTTATVSSDAGSSDVPGPVAEPASTITAATVATSVAPDAPAAPPTPTLLTVLCGFVREFQRTFFNGAPDARSQSVTVELDDPDRTPFAFSATDRDDDTLTFRVLGDRGPQHGTVTIDQATGTFTYTPDQAFAVSGGIDSFTYKVSDHGSRPHIPDLISFLTHPDFGHADIATVTVTVIPAEVPKSGIDFGYVDPNVRPQDDLYGYLNGRWLAEYEIPADRGRVNEYSIAQARVNQQIRQLLTELGQSGAAQGTDAQRLGDLFASFLDTDAVDRAGMAPLLAELSRIDGAADSAQLAAVLGGLDRANVTLNDGTKVIGAFAFWVDADKTDATRTVLYIDQAGLGLPDEAYYHPSQPSDILTAYPDHIAAMFALVYGGSPSDYAATAQRIVSLETRLAAAHWDVVKNRDAELIYNPRTFAELQAEAPGFDWSGWFAALGVTPEQVADVVVRQPDYLSAFAGAWTEESLDDWKEWSRWKLIHARASLLTEDVAAEDFTFYGTKLSGTPRIRERWQRGMSHIDGLMGDAVGRLYVERHFPPEAKLRVEQMVTNLLAAYRTSIEELDWMTPETRVKALQKLDKISVKVGYPDEWIDYTGLTIERDDLYGNVTRAAAASMARQLAKLGQPVDRAEWFITPQTVNAYYSPGTNEIVFPAAILQAPFFDPDVDDATNYGGIGATIGHEIGHAFDDQGSRYDGDGNLVDWWTDADRAEFTARGNMLIEQFNQYTPRQLEGQPNAPHVNGALTLGENIGDLGGIAIALKAYQLSLNGTPAPVIDGFTGVQRFFLASAQAERAKYRDADLRRLLATDPHAPAEFRVNGIFRNVDAFYEAFGIDESDALYLAPDQRARIWY